MISDQDDCDTVQVNIYILPVPRSDRAGHYNR